MAREGGAARVAFLIVFAMLAFAGNSLLCRVALRDTSIDAASFTSIRLASGALVLWVLLRSRGKQPLAAGSWPMAAMLFAYAVCFSFAYRDLTAATGALLLFGAVQLTMTAYGLFAGERLKGLRLIGVLIAIAGLVWLLLPGLSAPPPLAAGLMLAAGLAWGVYSLLGRGAGDATAATGGNFIRAMPFAAILSLAAATETSPDSTGLIYAVLSGAVTSGLGYVLWYAALPALSATSAATIQLCVPAIAALGGAVLLAEPITARLLLASAAILGGIALTIRKKS
ncbi:DMT family transporter [Reyranella sp.]|jgi:drug/metabolite transporter (DMT)-like permease|uniref:DMT family transporter n=1 Tax=Reyranella sp. TaxID=1929291 RepID=UPI000BC76E7C|nr:DMT family transporter [Reyranella sp.]OYY39868.1 MAG: EamA family transporter [Rhodospirillales bacterium 35-66-84]OYZ92312.1 MAG: EamA family transporter [Rhodospirillales bacterium 24-66-33]OZB22223.1 MAG: EamA family transporter [Rhodospirillales bacterium 39-66-50]HQS17841.1 DMT family transporter [Reyranella sp.]HQT14126.1 DMT family transporter [Reyranella sp.]